MRSVHRFCYWTAKILSFCSVFERHVAVNDTNLRLVTKKTLEIVPFARLSSCKMFRTAVCSANMLGFMCEVTNILSDFNKTCSFYMDFRRSSQYKISRKSDGWEPHWYDICRVTDGYDGAQCCLFAICGNTTNSSCKLLRVIIYHKQTPKRLWCLFMTYFHYYLDRP